MTVPGYISPLTKNAIQSTNTNFLNLKLTDTITEVQLEYPFLKPATPYPLCQTILINVPDTDKAWVVKMPDATFASTPLNILMFVPNVNAKPVVIKNKNDQTIATIRPALSSGTGLSGGVICVLTDNASVGGTWNPIPIGSLVYNISTASAGNGLTYSDGKLNVTVPPAVLSGTSYTQLLNKRVEFLNCLSIITTNSNFTYKMLSSNDLGTGATFSILNLGTGTTSIDTLARGIPTTIQVNGWNNGKQFPITLNPGEWITLLADGKSYSILNPLPQIYVYGPSISPIPPPPSHFVSGPDSSQIGNVPFWGNTTGTQLTNGIFLPQPSDSDNEKYLSVSSGKYTLVKSSLTPPLTLTLDSVSPTLTSINTGNGSALSTTSAGTSATVSATNKLSGDAIFATNTGSGNAILATSSSGTSKMGTITAKNLNASSLDSNAIYASQEGGVGNALYAESTGTGRAIYATSKVASDSNGTLYVTNTSTEATASAIFATTSGAGKTIHTTNTGSGVAIEASTIGNGSAIHATCSGSGIGISVDTGTAGTGQAIKATSLVSTSTDNAIPTSGTIYVTNTIETAKSAPAIFATSKGTNSSSGTIYATNASTEATASAIFATTPGAGKTIHTTNTGSGVAIEASTIGNGSAIHATSRVSLNNTIDKGTITAINSSTDLAISVAIYAKVSKKEGYALYAENTISPALGCIYAKVQGTSSTTQIGFETNGIIKANGTNFPSSVKIKNIIHGDVEDIQMEACSLFRTIPFFKYTYKDNSHKGNPIYGIVAEPLHEVMPHAVSIDEEIPSVNKNMVFELGMVALQQALKRIEILESALLEKEK
jgi:hypothetical protein